MKKIFAGLVVGLLLVLVASCGTNNPTGTAVLQKGPYMIYPADNTKMNVLWETDKIPAISKIAWGRDVSCVEGSANVTERVPTTTEAHEFLYALTGLATGVKYYFRVTIDGNSYIGSFTAAPPASATGVTFYYFADNQPMLNPPDGFESVAASLLRDMNKEASKRQTILLQGGDYVCRGRVDADWGAGFLNRNYPNITTLFGLLPILGAIGNHEYFNATGQLDTTQPVAQIDRYLPFPYHADYYYSFDYGPMHIAVIDTYTPFSRGSAQYRWLEEDLTNSTKPWKIPLFHEPAWGNNNNNLTIEAELCPLFKRMDVKLVLQAHIHDYCRCLVDGIQYVTLGAGGAPLNTSRGPAGSYDPTVIVKDAFVYSYGRFTIDGNTMNVTILDTSEGVVDSFSLTN